MLRRLALSYWTPAILGVALLGLHLAWGIWWEPTKRGEVVTGFGACLIVLGLFVVARPYIRAGKARLIAVALPQDEAGYVVDETYYQELLAAQDEARPEATRDFWAERVIGVGVIVAGTFFNGYGVPLVRWLGLEG